MRSCFAPESVHQTQVFSVLLAFLSFVHGWPIASAGAEINALSGRNVNRAANEGGHLLNDLNANEDGARPF
jgi:hypothetical protein